jgi:hypothetical protein
VFGIVEKWTLCSLYSTLEENGTFVKGKESSSIFTTHRPGYSGDPFSTNLAAEDLIRRETARHNAKGMFLDVACEAEMDVINGLRWIRTG